MDKKTIDRIRKLLNLTEERGATEAEAAAAAKKAQEIALEYGISFEDISAEDKARSEEPGVETAYRCRNVSEWKWRLLQRIAYVNGCFVFLNHEKWVQKDWYITSDKMFTVAGTEMNRFVVVETFNYLSKTVEELAQEEIVDVRRRIRIKELRNFQLKPTEFLRAFREGCSHRLCARLLENYQWLISHGSGSLSAIVVAEYYPAKRQEAKEWAYSKFNLKSSRQKRVKDYSEELGYQLGKEAADCVQLTQTKELGAKN